MARAYTTEAEASAVGAEPPVRPGPSGGRRPPRRWCETGAWRRGWVLAVLAAALAGVMVVHSRVPNAVGNLGSLLETFLPWCGLGVPLLLLAALLRRSLTGLVALLLPALVWASLFGGLLTDKTAQASEGDLTVLSHNVDAANPDPAGTAAALADAEADVLALAELPARALDVYEEALAQEYPHHTVQGTVGVWSRYPLTDSEPVDIKIGWNRALRTTVRTPQGEVAVYAAHLPSVRVKVNAGFTAGQRDDAAEQLGQAIAREPLGRVVLLGDLNGTMNDRALAPVTAQMRSTQGAAGAGFGFTWPASFPLTRIDQIMVKGIEPVSSWTLPATGSDHLPVAASVTL
ncbi:endonuclease/exonuclease/phosphatase family protein [Streptomyces sp. TRM 70351]|uniref:endonuclease/exonuclease/phosphatase family protein n=1 Tax=Streptomyces sp. TRM 70351 TaxID=3116552 RepID=UPI002E7C2AFE|nr:endonuclease/exonuclease/phosphatase family protein [Streptomyces sp. TRM 70351]MEE1928599.1 endonuclease/exonuclease/phosphatase family protein [Streptomyces sp. TRM 70351]